MDKKAFGVGAAAIIVGILILLFIIIYSLNSKLSNASDNSYEVLDEYVPNQYEESRNNEVESLSKDIIECYENNVCNYITTYYSDIKTSEVEDYLDENGYDKIDIDFKFSKFVPEKKYYLDKDGKKIVIKGRTVDDDLNDMANLIISNTNPGSSIYLSTTFDGITIDDLYAELKEKGQEDVVLDFDFKEFESGYSYIIIYEGNNQYSGTKLDESVSWR